MNAKNKTSEAPLVSIVDDDASVRRSTRVAGRISLPAPTPPDVRDRIPHQLRKSMNRRKRTTLAHHPGRPPGDFFCSRTAPIPIGRPCYGLAPWTKSPGSPDHLPQPSRNTRSSRKANLESL